MTVHAPKWPVGVLFALVSLFSQPAQAWVETAVRSHEARVEVERDGTAVVRHELVLRIRGGPMKSLEIGGVGTIGDPLPDAVVRRAIEGSSSAWPLTVSSLEDGSLRLGIGAQRGIRGGSYLFAFAYEIDLKSLQRIAPVSDGIELTFIGPRLTSGVDSAKVTFVVPRGSRAPRLGEQDDTGANVLLGEVRRGAQSDEVELVRAHLATGEPAIWRVVVAPDALASSAMPRSAEDEESATLPAVGVNTSGLLDRDASRRYLPVVGLLALVFGLLVLLKARMVKRAAQLSDARIKPLVPGPAALRGLIVAAAVAGGAYLTLRQEPWGAVGALCVACIVSTYLLPVRIVRPRGPGHWEPVELPSRPSGADLPGAIFETRSGAGFALFSVLTFAIMGAAYRILPQSNYFALMILALQLLLVPLFWTGRRGDFPQDPVEQARPWLSFLQRAIEQRVAKLELWGRRAGLAADGVGTVSEAARCDETRIRILLDAAPSGLRALEVSLDEAAGASVFPCVVIRALEDSRVVRALPTDIPWQRGRAAEERVAILRPTAPTKTQLLRLLRTLLANLRAAAQSSSSVARSSGSGASATKVAASPASQLT